jgi:esterase
LANRRENRDRSDGCAENAAHIATALAQPAPTTWTATGEESPVYLNRFSPGLEPIDMRQTEEWQSLLQSAADLGIQVPADVRYESRNVVVNGLRFHVLEWGPKDGPPLLLLHGGNQTAHSWDLVSLHLANKFRIVAVDQRGHGDSEWPRDCVASPQDMASDAYEIIRLLGLERPVVMGHSMGGIVTMTLLKAHPGIARAAVLVDVGPELSEAGTKIIGEFIGSLSEFASVDEFIDRVVAYDPFRSREHISRTVRYNLLQRADGPYVSKHDPRRRMLQQGQGPIRIDRPTLDDVRLFEMPVLLVRGAESNVLTAEPAERFRDALPKGELVTVERCGHNVHSQNTAGFLEAVEPFLDRTAAL